MASEVRLWTDPFQVVSFNLRTFDFIAEQIVILFVIGRNRTDAHYGAQPLPIPASLA
jgi:hypothetical protein